MLTLHLFVLNQSATADTFTAKIVFQPSPVSMRRSSLYIMLIMCLLNIITQVEHLTL